MSGIVKHYLFIPALIALLLNIMGCDSSPEEIAPYPLEAGLWGSEEARLEITDLGGEITFTCAAGTIDEKIWVSQEPRLSPGDGRS